MELKDKVYQRPDLVAANMGEETVMMDAISGKYYKLSGVGGDIWDKIQNPISVEDLINLLVSEYDISADECRKQTIEFLSQMIDKGIVLIEK